MTSQIADTSLYRHLAHASDADEASELLTRWRIDGKGKLAGMSEAFYELISELKMYFVLQSLPGWRPSRKLLAYEPGPGLLLKYKPT